MYRRWSLLVSMAFLLWFGFLRAQKSSVFPDTPAGRQFREWLEVFNRGELSIIQSYLRRNRPSWSDKAKAELRLEQQTGGFELLRVEKSTELECSGTVKEISSDQYAGFTIEVEAQEPHRISRLDIKEIPRPADLPSLRMSQGQAVAAIKTKLDQAAAQDRFSGAVLISKNGKAVFSGAYGFADRKNRIRNNLNTRFRIGSMNKMMTAVSILQLVEAGRINLESPLTSYITNYPNRDWASKVTIHQLLTHTGGAGDIFGPEFTAHRKQLRTLQDYLELYGSRDPEFAPGTSWSYSNYGFLLLGVVIEHVSGESYYDYVNEHVYKVAGMTSSGSLAEDEEIPNRSVGYTKSETDEEWHPNIDTLPYRGTSAGGGYSTVSDLVRFAMALTDHKLLDAHYTELLMTGKVDTPRGKRYAYGFWDTTNDGVRSWGHAGGAPGMNGSLQIYSQTGYVVAVLANVDPPIAERIADFIGNRLPGK